MSTPNSKVRELELSTEIKAMGFTSARFIGKLLSLTHKSDATVQSRFDMNDIPTSIKKLQNAINANNKIALDKSYHSGNFTILFADMLVLSIEQEHARQESERTRDQVDKQKIIEEITKDRNTLGDISLEEWEKTRKQKYLALYRCIKENSLHSLWQPLEFTLSVKCILNISGVEKPFAGIILGPPSSLKTVSIMTLKRWPQTYYTDNFSAKSLVTHISGLTEDELRWIDMLPNWKNRHVLLPEMSPTFTTKEEDLMQLIGILTRVLDGDGYISNSGAQGQRGYDEKIHFVLTGASVDIPYRVYKVIGYLGPKIYFIRQSKETRKWEDRLSNMSKDFSIKEREVQAALFDYLKWLEIRPDMEVDKESSLPKIKWDYSKDVKEAKEYILKLTDLLAPLRGVAQTWESKKEGGDYGYTIPIIEDTARAEARLYDLARGHALSQGRNYIILEDISLLIKVVLSTGPIERVKLLDKLLAVNGRGGYDDDDYLTTVQITGSLEISRPIARRAMIELTILGLLDMWPKLGTEDETLHSEGMKVKLKSEFLKWLNTDEFKELRAGFVPDDTDSETDADEHQDQPSEGNESI